MSRDDSEDVAHTSNLEQDIVRLVSKYHSYLYRYILTLVPNETDARDILQETCVDLVKRARDYDTGREFLPWAYRFAYLEVLNFRKKHGRSKLVFDNDIVETLASELISETEDDLESRLAALEECLDALEDGDRELVEIRYFQHEALEDLIASTKLSRRTVFRQLSRIRQLLLDCIRTKLAKKSGRPA